MSLTLKATICLLLCWPSLLGIFLFSIISAIAFATVLGTVSGLIVAASGAVAHDLMDRFLNLQLSEKQKVMAGKVAAIVVGIIAIILGIVFKGMNVSFLVGWAFAVAASANLPAIIMLLFWKRTTSRGLSHPLSSGSLRHSGLFFFHPPCMEDMVSRLSMLRFLWIIGNYLDSSQFFDSGGRFSHDKKHQKFRKSQLKESRQ